MNYANNLFLGLDSTRYLSYIDGTFGLVNVQAAYDALSRMIGCDVVCNLILSFVGSSE